MGRRGNWMPPGTTTQPGIAIVNATMARFARLERGGPREGLPMLCTATRGEREGWKQRRNHAANDGKVIFPDREAAEACARALTSELNFQLLRAYECERSRRGHHHLTSAVERAR